MTDHYFKKFKLKSENLIYRSPSLVVEEKFERILGQDVLFVPEEIWLQEPLLRHINNRFQIAVGFIIKTLPYDFYNWHTDTNRAAAINLKLSTESQSHTLFSVDIDECHESVVELNYEFKNFYLFNTQHKHSVLNLNRDRYLFSIEFKQSKDQITYKEIYDWCALEGLFDD